MNADSTFQIGHDHTVCEDYAIAGNLADRITYAIVCDGCSASPDVDFGARVLAMAARETLQYKLHVEDGLFEGMNPNLSAERFGQITINKAQEVCRGLRQLHPQALDATLLAAWVQNEMATVYMYGDGVFIHRMENGTHKVHIHLTSGAPDYLSYSLDKGRKKSYDALADNQKVVDVQFASGTGIATPTLKPLEPYAVTVPVKPGEILAVISDGINSFRRSNNEDIDWATLVEEFTGFKTLEGQFVQRRIKAFKRKCAKDGIQHLDDISVAAIVV
jgi:serine/threonine protein phosphatase PrpC